MPRHGHRGDSTPNKKAPTGNVEALGKTTDETTAPVVYHTEPSGSYTGIRWRRERGQIVAERRDRDGRHLTAYLPTRVALMELLAQPGGLCAATADYIVGGIS